MPPSALQREQPARPGREQELLERGQLLDPAEERRARRGWSTTTTASASAGGVTCKDRGNAAGGGFSASNSARVCSLGARPAATASSRRQVSYCADAASGRPDSR